MRRAIASILLMSFPSSACTRWRLEQPAPQSASKLRVTLADGRRLELHNAQLIGDSVVGLELPTTQGKLASAVPVRRAFAVAELNRIERRKFDGVRTFFAVVGAGAVAALIVLWRALVALKNS